jgi:hypothetical protein
LSLHAATDPSLPSLRDRNAIDDERLSTVALLHDVVKDPRFALRRHELRALASAVKGGGSREAVWRGVNLQQAFPPESTLQLPPRRRHRMAGVLGALGVGLALVSAWWTLWSFREGVDLEAASSSATLLLWGVLAFVGAWSLSRSARRADKHDHEQGAAQLAQALNCASITINSGEVRDPIQGVDALTEAAAELLRAHQATRQSLQVLQSAAQRLEDSTNYLASGADAIGRSLGQHTGALQHQISELTQVRASLERLSGLAPFDDALAGRTPHQG